MRRELKQLYAVREDINCGVQINPATTAAIIDAAIALIERLLHRGKRQTWEGVSGDLAIDSDGRMWRRAQSGVGFAWVLDSDGPPAD